MLELSADAVLASAVVFCGSVVLTVSFPLQDVSSSAMLSVTTEINVILFSWIIAPFLNCNKIDSYWFMTAGYCCSFFYMISP